MPLIAPTTKITTPNGTAAAGTGSGSSALQGMGSEAFMKLLVAQMKYQNPMAPSDGTQYLAQISQYAMVEQLQKVNQGQQEVSTYQRALIAGSMIGKVVSGVSDSGRTVNGEVTGVTFQAGRPVLTTTDGDLPVDRVDTARLPTNPKPGATSTTTSTATSTTTATGTATPALPN